MHKLSILERTNFPFLFAEISNLFVFFVLPLIAPQLSGQINYTPQSWQICHNGGGGNNFMQGEGYNGKDPIFPRDMMETMFISTSIIF